MAEAWASAEMYLAPLVASAALMAASSVFQRSSWKFDHDTPTTISLAMAAIGARLAEASIAAPSAIILTDFMYFLP